MARTEPGEGRDLSCHSRADSASETGGQRRVATEGCEKRTSASSRRKQTGDSAVGAKIWRGLSDGGDLRVGGTVGGVRLKVRLSI